MAKSILASIRTTALTLGLVALAGGAQAAEPPIRVGSFLQDRMDRL